MADVTAMSPALSPGRNNGVSEQVLQALASAADAHVRSAAQAQAQAQQVGELIAEIRTIGQAQRDTWSKINELSGYVHKSNQDSVNQTSANAGGLLLLRKDFEHLTGAVSDLTKQNEELAGSVKELTTIATKGEGAWIVGVKILAIIAGLSAAYAAIKTFFGAGLP